MLGILAIFSAFPFFFLSALWVMIFWGIVAPWVDVDTLSYGNSLVVTLGLWMGLAPLALAVGKMSGKID